MAALEPVKVFRGAPTQIADESQLGSVSSVYTVATGKRLIIKYIRITNLEPTEANSVNIKTGTAVNASTTDNVIRALKVQPYDIVIFEMNEILNAGEKIYLWQDALTNVAVQISGVEVTL